MSIDNTATPAAEQTLAVTAETPAPEVLEEEMTAVPALSAEPATEEPVQDITPEPTVEPIVTEAVTSAAPDVTAVPDPEPAPKLNGGVLAAALVVALVVLAAAAVYLKKKGILKMPAAKAKGAKKAPQRKPAGKKPAEKKQDHDVPSTEPCAPATEITGTAAAYHGPKISAGMAQTVGARKNQQDSLYCSDWKNLQTLGTRGLLAAVADGIGGLSDGNLASSTAMQTMRARFLAEPAFGSMSDRLLDLAAAAQREVLSINHQRTQRSGTTLVTALISGWKMVFLSIGDSRICLYRAGGLLQLNREHNLGRQMSEQYALGMDRESAGRKPEALTSYLGKENLQLIDRSTMPLELVPGDKIVLMSDGVFGTLSDSELISALRKSPETAAAEIIDAIEERKKPHQDNASVLVIGIE